MGLDPSVASSVLHLADQTMHHWVAVTTSWHQIQAMAGQQRQRCWLRSVGGMTFDFFGRLVLEVAVSYLIATLWVTLDLAEAAASDLAVFDTISAVLDLMLVSASVRFDIGCPEFDYCIG